MSAVKKKSKSLSIPETPTESIITSSIEDVSSTSETEGLKENKPQSSTFKKIKRFSYYFIGAAYVHTTHFLSSIFSPNHSNPHNQRLLREGLLLASGLLIFKFIAYDFLELPTSSHQDRDFTRLEDKVKDLSKQIDSLLLTMPTKENLNASVDARVHHLSEEWKKHVSSKIHTNSEKISQSFKADLLKFQENTQAYLDTQITIQTQNMIDLIEKKFASDQFKTANFVFPFNLLGLIEALRDRIEKGQAYGKELLLLKQFVKFFDHPTLISEDHLTPLDQFSTKGLPSLYVLAEELDNLYLQLIQNIRARGTEKGWGKWVKPLPGLITAQTKLEEDDSEIASVFKAAKDALVNNQIQLCVQTLTPVAEKFPNLLDFWIEMVNGRYHVLATLDQSKENLLDHLQKLCTTSVNPNNQNKTEPHQNENQVETKNESVSTTT